MKLNLSINYLENIQDSENLPILIEEIINILLSSINDWPTLINNLEDYKNEVSNLIGNDIYKKSIEDYIVKIDYSKHAWEGESLSQLIEIYDYYNEDTKLEEIFNDLQNQINILNL